VIRWTTLPWTSANSSDGPPARGGDRRTGAALVGLHGHCHCLLALGHAAWPYHEAGHEQEAGSSELSEVPGERERGIGIGPWGPCKMSSFAARQRLHG
jgi:hypothetical protein